MVAALASLATSGTPKTLREPKLPSPSSTTGSAEGSAPSYSAGWLIVPARKASAISPPWSRPTMHPWSDCCKTAASAFVSPTASPAPSNTRSPCPLAVSAVADRSRGHELATPESTQQCVKFGAETARGQGDLVFDGAGLAVGDTKADAAVLQQSDHGCIVGRDQGGEMADAFLAGTISQPAE